MGNQAAAALRNIDCCRPLALRDSVIQVVGGLLGTTMTRLVASDWLAAMGAFLTREEAIKTHPEVLGGFVARAL